MRFWKAFDTGKGERMVQDNMPSIEIPKVKVVQAFPEACFSSGTMARSSKHTEEEKASPTDTENVERDALFECPSDGCTCSFGSETELHRHLDVGNHVRRLHRESQFDYIRLRYADMVNEELSKPLFGANYPSESQHSGMEVSSITMGWALKKHKSTRFSTAVKAYLNDKFLIGEETGNKASPTQVAREMRRERDDEGNRLFVGGDCLSSQQIAAYFSRLAATKKKHGSLNAAASSDEVEEFLTEQQMQEHEEDISRRKKVVFGNLQLQHPITYKSYNLCKLAADGKLTKTFSIADLNDICDSLDIETEDFKRRKAPYKDALTNVLSSCTCNKK